MAAEGERPSVNFNHDQTTFPLRGLHTNAACEACHVNGVFKGAPNTCEGCHNRGGANTAKLKPATLYLIVLPVMWLKVGCQQDLITRC